MSRGGPAALSARPDSESALAPQIYCYADIIVGGSAIAEIRSQGVVERGVVRESGPALRLPRRSPNVSGAHQSEMIGDEPFDRTRRNHRPSRYRRFRAARSAWQLAFFVFIEYPFQKRGGLFRDEKRLLMASRTSAPMSERRSATPNIKAAPSLVGAPPINAVTKKPARFARSHP